MNNQEKIAEMLSLNARMEKHMTQLESQEYVARLLTEMAYPRQEFKRKADELTTQITQNWCLINYAKLTNNRQEVVEHWKNELSAHITNVAKMKIKKNNSFSMRVNALNEVWVDESEIGRDYETVNMTIFFKFREEQIPTDDEVYQQVISNLMNEVPILINIMAQGDLCAIQTYITNL